MHAAKVLDQPSYLGLARYANVSQRMQSPQDTETNSNMQNGY